MKEEKNLELVIHHKQIYMKALIFDSRQETVHICDVTGQEIDEMSPKHGGGTQVEKRSFHELKSWRSQFRMVRQLEGVGQNSRDEKLQEGRDPAI